MKEENERERKFLLDSGMINKFVYAGIQPDDCVVWKRIGTGVQNTSICNHNCTIQVNRKLTGGNYVCNSSFSLNKGTIMQFASREAIVDWTKKVVDAHGLMREMFFANHFNSYCELFKIPTSWANAIKTELTSPEKRVEINRFGGSPEMLPECPKIISDCKKIGLVNLTTPGRRFMFDAKFVVEVAENPPNILAMSFDDLSATEVSRIAQMDLQKIRDDKEEGWPSVSPFHGQKQKAYEGFYAARLMRELKVPITLLFNMVIHPGNVNHLDDLVSILIDKIPGVIANPYPAQSFGSERNCWTQESLPALRKHILDIIQKTLTGTPGITRRLHYYIFLEAAYRKWYKSNPNRLIEFLSGRRAWDCTLRPGAYRYAQIVRNLDILDVPQGELPLPGGHIGDFWNPHWATRKQVHEFSVEELAEFMLTGVGKWARRFLNGQLSNIMPRLMFDIVTTELGILDELIDEYLFTRMEYAGF